MDQFKAKIQITEALLWKLLPAINAKRGRANKQANIKGFVSPIECVSFKVNGGFNGLEERKRFYQRLSTIK